MTAVVVFAASVAGFLYFLAGYPLLVWALSRGRRRRSLPPQPGTPPRVTAIVPVRNGVQWVSAKLDTLRALDYPRELLQIVVVSDGSTDGTDEVVRRHPAGAVLLSNQGSGKAEALNTALPAADGEILFLTDIRQPLDPQALRWLVAQFDDPQVGVATGELMIGAPAGGQGHQAGLYWRFEKWMRKRHSDIDSVLGATGAIYAIRRSLAGPLPPGTLLDDMLMPLRAFLQGFRIVFVPEAVAWDVEADLKGEFRRKVRTQAGVYQLVGLCPRLLGPGNRMWFHFVSHKLGRLMLPWLLLAAVISTPFLPSPWGAALTAAEAGVIALGLLDPALRGTPLGRLSSTVRTFGVLMAAALCAVSILFVRADLLWAGGAKVTTPSPEGDGFSGNA